MAQRFEQAVTMIRLERMSILCWNEMRKETFPGNATKIPQRNLLSLGALYFRNNRPNLDHCLNDYTLSVPRTMRNSISWCKGVMST